MLRADGLQKKKLEDKKGKAATGKRGRCLMCKYTAHSR